MSRATAVFALLMAVTVPALHGQRDTVIRRYDATLHADGDSVQRTTYDVQRSSWRRSVVRYGKWLTAGTAVALTVMASREHQASEREWDALLAVCHSAPDACALGPDGRYLRADAERLYQQSRAYDGRATRRLVGAQAALLVSAALFIIDLRPGAGPENIPYSPVEVAGGPARDGAWVGARITF
jgi:hypothetical protein